MESDADGPRHPRPPAVERGLENALMRTIVRWALRTFGQDTLITISLIWVIFFAMSYGLGEIIFKLDGGLLAFLAMIAVILGWRFARSRIHTGWTWLGLITTGFLLNYSISAGILAPLEVLVERLVAWLPVWINHLGDPQLPLPDDRLVRLAAGDLLAAINGMAQRLSLWLGGLFGGKSRFDQLVSIFLWGLAIWICAAWAAWAIRRLRSPLLAIAPGAVLFAGVVNFARAGVYWIVPILAISFLLLAFIRQKEREQQWIERGVDYSVELRTDLMILVVPLVAVIMLISIIVPSISVRAMVTSVRKWAAPQASQVEQVGRSLGLNREIQPDTFISNQRSPGLPRAHLLDAGPDLTKQPVMTIKIQGEPYLETGKNYYWRSLTYDIYNSAGWETSRTEMKTYKAGEPAASSSQPWRQVVQEQVTLEKGGEGELYAAGDLITANQDFQAALREPQQAGDLFGARIDAQTYQARSLIPLVGAADLRAAGEEYPDWIRERYLQLPPDIPQRVHDLATKIVAGENTPYDQAKAIETYLRSFPYTLKIPKPPEDVDVADYFLFDLQKGYCDYYSTAMVVLARITGLPAREAIGYASGRFDQLQQAYFVTEADAHSWPEIYFPKIGWVNFEPTAARSDVVLPETVPPSEQQLPPMQVSPWVGLSRMLRDIRAWPVIIGFLFLIGWAIVRWVDRLRLSLSAPEKTVYELFSRIKQRDRLIASHSIPGETPEEFSRRLVEAAGKAGRIPVFGGLLRPVQEEIRELARLYEQASYSPRPVQNRERIEALRGWDRLDWRLWLLWLAKKGRLI